MVRVGVWSRVSVSFVTFCHFEASEIISSIKNCIINF